MGWIEELATLCGYLSVIATLCAAIYRFSRRLERMERHQHNDYLCMLRLMILSEELPVEERLKAVMAKIYDESAAAAAEYGLGDDLMAGSCIASFRKIAQAMVAQGC